MFSKLVQPLRCSQLRGILSTYLKASCITLLLAHTLPASAQWQDPLESPSVKTMRTHESLMLDITSMNNKLVAVGSYGHIIMSTNHGQTWQQANVPVTTTLTSVYFATENLGWVAGHDGLILHTQDGGKNWAKQFDGYRANQEIVASLEVAFKNAQEQLEKLEAQGNAEAIAEAEEELENLEFSLEDARYDYETGSTKPFLDLWFHNANQGYAVGAYGMLFYTENGGKAWQNISSRLPNPDNYHLNSITYLGDDKLIIAGERGTLFFSADFGATWELLDSPYDGSLFGVLAHNQQQYLFGLRGNLYRSNDFGQRWQAIELDTRQGLIGGLSLENKSILVGNAGVIIELDNQGSSTLHTIEGSKSFSAIIQAADGNFIAVGEAGIMRLTPQLEIHPQAVEMAAGEL